MKKELVVFVGCKTCGKNYRTKQYVNEKGFTEVSFAEPLRQILWNIMGWQPEDFQEYNELKEAPLSVEKTKKVFNLIPFFESKNVTSIRTLLQNLGSYMRNNFGKDFWVNKWFEAIEPLDKIVVSDARYTNEVRKILNLSRKGYSVSFYWCCYEGADFNEILRDTHESERFSQFIYKNREKYNLKDGCRIPNYQMIKIVREFEGLNLS